MKLLARWRPILKATSGPEPQRDEGPSAPAPLDPEKWLRQRSGEDVHTPTNGESSFESGWGEEPVFKPGQPPPPPPGYSPLPGLGITPSIAPSINSPAKPAASSYASSSQPAQAQASPPPAPPLPSADRLKEWHHRCPIRHCSRVAPWSNHQQRRSSCPLLCKNPGKILSSNHPHNLRHQCNLVGPLINLLRPRPPGPAPLQAGAPGSGQPASRPNGSCRAFAGTSTTGNTNSRFSRSARCTKSTSRSRRSRYTWRSAASAHRSSFCSRSAPVVSGNTARSENRTRPASAKDSTYGRPCTQQYCCATALGARISRKSTGATSTTDATRCVGK